VLLLLEARETTLEEHWEKDYASQRRLMNDTLQNDDCEILLEAKQGKASLEGNSMTASLPPTTAASIITQFQMILIAMHIMRVSVCLQLIVERDDQADDRSGCHTNSKIE
jgi:hypothetical protein